MNPDNPVEAYYDGDPQREWERLERHRTEFAVTGRVLSEFLPRGARVLDIGGGPGRYAIWLARQGHPVTLLDLSRENLRFARRKAEEAGLRLEGFLHGNALELSGIGDATFDAALLLGPLYHLLELADRQRAVGEALRVLRPGGLLFAAFITRFSFLRDSAANYPDWLEAHHEYVMGMLENGRHHQPQKGGFTQAHFAHPDEVLPLMEGAGLHTLRLQGCEGVVSRVEDGVNALQGQAWEQWVEVNYRLGQEPSLWGASDHLLHVGRKI